MMPFPSNRTPADQILARMRQAREHDAKWHEGRVWSLVYHAGDEMTDLLKEAYTLFFSENGLNPMVFPSLRQFEAEVVAMTANLLGGDDETAGSMTAGGTESILMAVKTSRDWARAERPAVTAPEMILPQTAHPAFHKAGHYFGVRPVVIPVGPDLRADVAAARAAINPNTILMVGSAPSYPHGVVDPIADLAEIAQENGLLCHADACVGGFMLPFVRKLGYPVPNFDLRVAGVTSMSADLHKYGYAAKGASVILYRNRHLRRYQFHVYADWPGGVYASPGMAGTRPGGPIAAAWAILNYLGEEGYLALTNTVMKTARKLQDGIRAIPELQILGEPVMSIMAIASDRLNVFEIGDEMALRGWILDRQQFPPSLHLTVTPAHAQTADQFLADLCQVVRVVKRPSRARLSRSLQVRLAQAAARVLPPRLMSRLTRRSSGTGGGALGAGGRSAALYGMMATLPNRGDLHEVVLDLLDQLTGPPQ
ncbi:MAG: aspartate aminotransferase family protein [Anaerolineae bacterium]|nr:aspartate aminotransferase family protein [Anaerolineae bacterium]